jgi:hypothetical protein
MLKRDHYFQCLTEYRVVCRLEDNLIKANGIAIFGGLNFFSLVIFSELGNSYLQTGF